MVSVLQITDVTTRQMATEPRHALIHTPIRMYISTQTLCSFPEVPSRLWLLSYSTEGKLVPRRGYLSSIPLSSNLSLPRSVPFLQKQCFSWQRAGEKLYKRPGGSYCPFSFTSSTCFSPELISSKTTYLSHVGGSLWFNPESRERRRKWKVRTTSS